jgi:pyocin large subunit-like protein
MLDVASFDAAELAIHYAKHRTDFAVATDKEYERLADLFLTGPPHPNLKKCNRKHGDLVRYDTVTQEYGVLAGGGIIRTYFKPIPCASLPVGAPPLSCHEFPNNVEYFLNSCLHW